MRRLLIFLFQLLFLAVIIFLLTAAWMVLDGLSDQGGKADVALVLGRVETSGKGPGAEVQPRLDRVVQLYNEGRFPAIIVVGSTQRGNNDEPEAMATYLEAQGIPSSAIFEDQRGGTMQEAARDVAGIMKSHQFVSLMLITDYYRVTRTKMVLGHEGIDGIQKAHVGKLQKEDAMKIAHEVVALYDYLGRNYLLPMAEKVKEEAKVGADKAKVDAQNAKETVDKKLDSLPK
jgi:vancomycin permeability regulator SanA